MDGTFEDYRAKVMQIISTGLASCLSCLGDRIATGGSKGDIFEGTWFRASQAIGDHHEAHLAAEEAWPSCDWEIDLGMQLRIES